MFALIALAIALGVLVWVIGLTSLDPQFKAIIKNVCIFIWVAAALATLFGIDLLGMLRRLGHR